MWTVDKSVLRGKRKKEHEKKMLKKIREENPDEFLPFKVKKYTMLKKTLHYEFTAKVNIGYHIIKK